MIRDQTRLGPLHFLTDDVLERSAAHLLAEKPDEMALGQAGEAGKVVRAGKKGGMAAHIAQDLLDTAVARSPLGLGRAEKTGEEAEYDAARLHAGEELLPAGAE